MTDRHDPQQVDTSMRTALAKRTMRQEESCSSVRNRQPVWSSVSSVAHLSNQLVLRVEWTCVQGAELSRGRVSTVLNRRGVNRVRNRRVRDVAAAWNGASDGGVAVRA